MCDEFLRCDTQAIWLYFSSQESHFKISVKLCSEWDRGHSSKFLNTPSFTILEN
jgi:hypothetical protein